MMRRLWAALFGPAPDPEPPFPETPARIHDYRGGSRWGHALHVEGVEPPGGWTGGTLYKGHMFAGRCDRGDHVLWSTKYGHAVARVLIVDTKRDPGDMHFITLEIIERVEGPPPPPPRQYLRDHNH